MRQISIPAHIREHLQPNDILISRIGPLRERFGKLLKGDPEVSVVIPAYNEEENILQTLSSLSCTRTNRSVEFIVVDNNSKDRTAEFIQSAGAVYVLETQQGVTHARNAGLRIARGKYIINADADTIYPPDWVECLVKPLDNPATAVGYGRYSFIPVGATTRFTYFFYEHVADSIRLFNRLFREEAVNVYGCSSSFRRAQGLQVEGYNHPPTATEDGYLALKLRNKGFGRLHPVTQSRSLVWTTDRRLQMDGGLWKALQKRAKRIFLGKR